jgi:hypothetical protein
MPTIGDDERQYWNPEGLFAERAASYFRRPARSGWRGWLAIAIVVVVLALIVIALIRPLL